MPGRSAMSPSMLNTPSETIRIFSSGGQFSRQRSKWSRSLWRNRMVRAGERRAPSTRLACRLWSQIMTSPFSVRAERVA